MLRIAFIDHAYHQVTKSAHFFVDLLRERFDVSIYYAGVQSEDLVNDIVLGNFDIVVLWQTEYLAPFFVAARQRVVCVPMYDGTGQAPDHFWTHMHQTRVINFCQALHNRLTSMGLTSLPVQYMKDPAAYAPVTDYSSPRVVFWQRLPEQGLTADRVRAIVGPQAHLHVHNAPDLVAPERYPAATADSVSHFDLDRNALAEALDAGNVFVCPRYAEGIGMALLEAMARGMVIIAHDGPTHNEYVTHGIDGWLIDMSQPASRHWPLDLDGKRPPAPVDTAAQDKAARKARKKARRDAERAAFAAPPGTMVRTILTANPDAPLDDDIFLGTQPGSWPAILPTAPVTAGSMDEDIGRLERMGRAARSRAEQIHAGWMKSRRDILDFIEETPVPTGLRLSDAKRNRLARETEIWMRDPHRLIRRMGRWEAQGIVLRDRQRMTRAEKKRMRRRQTWAWRSGRVLAIKLHHTLRTLRWIRHIIRTRL